MGENRAHSRHRGFTLIELSVVLVIIGLIAGSIVAGRSLINAAYIHAQISQIDKFNIAANVFREKYSYLPGDIPALPAAQFGFVARGQYSGEGDGNGVLEGVSADAPASNTGWIVRTGEIPLFWEDLAAAHLIDATLNTATANTNFGSQVFEPAISKYFPSAKISSSAYVYVFSYNGVNYFAVSGVTEIFTGGVPGAATAMTVQQALAIDSKIDDGIPISGRVEAAYPDANHGSNFYHAPNGVAASSTTCYDTTSNQYSVMQSGGSGFNCGLSFRMQTGD